LFGTAVKTTNLHIELTELKREATAQICYPGKFLSITVIFKTLRASACNLATEIEPPLFREIIRITVTAVCVFAGGIPRLAL